jgi:hypothetical protein
MYCAWALALSAGQFLCAVLFFLRLDEISARRLLRASLVYLPLVMILLMLEPI